MNAQEKIDKFAALVEQCKENFKQMDALFPPDYDCSYPVKNGHGDDAQQSIGLAEECLDEAWRAFRLGLSNNRDFTEVQE